MWILDKSGACIYNVDTCREISVMSDFEIGIANGVGVKEKNYYALGFYANHQRTREVFDELVHAIGSGRSCIYVMPRE